MLSCESDIPSILLTTGLVVRKSLLLVFLPTLPPVTAVIAPVTATATTTTTSTTATTAAPTPVTTTATVGLDPASCNVLGLLFTVFLLALDYQVLALPLGLGIELQESLLFLFRLEFNENASLEGLVGCATETDGVCGTVGREERFNVELGAGFLISKSLSVDTPAHGLVLEDLDDVGVMVRGHRLGEGVLAAHAGVVVGKLERLRRLESFDDGAERLEAAHALEGMQEVKRNGVVGASANLGEQELVRDKVGVREVEFNLLADLNRVVGLLQSRRVELGVRATLVTLVAMISFLGLGLFGVLGLLAQLCGSLDNTTFLGIFLLFGRSAVCGSLLFSLQLGQGVLDILLGGSVDVDVRHDCDYNAIACESRLLRSTIYLLCPVQSIISTPSKFTLEI